MLARRSATCTVGNVPAGTAVDDTRNTIYVASKGTDALSVMIVRPATLKSSCLRTGSTQSVGAGAYQVAVGEGQIYNQLHSAHSVLNRPIDVQWPNLLIMPVTTINIGVARTQLD